MIQKILFTLNMNGIEKSITDENISFSEIILFRVFFS